MKKITFLVILLSALTTYAQDLNILWQKTLGGSGNDKLWTIIQTNDGGFFVGGDSDSPISGEKNENSRGGYDYWVIKLDSNGSTVWQRTYGGIANERLWSVQQTSDDGFILGGYSNSDISGDKTENSRGGDDYWVIKLNSSGDIEWQKTIGGSDDDRMISIVETNDGGYLLGGDSKSPISGDRTYSRIGFQDIWLVKLNSSGDIDWQKSFGHGNHQSITGLAKTIDGGYIISSTAYGYTGTHDSFWVLKISASGNYIWDKTIQGDNFDWFPKISTTTDGGYIMAGASDSNAFNDKSEDSRGSFDYWIVKLDEVGNVLWDKTLGGSESEQADSIIQCADGGYLVSGYSGSDISGDKTQNSKGASDYWIIKLNSVGIVEWQNTIGGEGTDARARAIQTQDGNYVIAGYSDSNISGDKTEDSRGEVDYWIVKHAATLGMEENPFSTTINLYPNPTKNTLQLETQEVIINQVIIYTITGSKVLQLETDSVSPIIDVSSLVSGVYFIQLYSQKNVVLKKFVKE